MSLTTGRGPHGPKPAGRFVDGAYVEPFERRVRGLNGGSTVVDSNAVLLVHRPGHPPTYAFPTADVTGVASTPEPLADGYVAVAWDAVDHWFEELDEVVGHPRNPYHRIDILPTTRRLRVEVDGVALVDTTDTLLLCETALAPRLYVAKAHVAMDRLAPDPGTSTYCPYKGTASYWRTAEVAGVAWSYEQPTNESLSIAGFLSFDHAKATVLAELP